MSQLAFSLVLAAWPIAYITALAYLLVRKRWPFRAGAASSLIAPLPLIYLILTLPNEEIDAPGTGILLMLTAIPFGLSLLVLTVGSVIAAVRLARRRHAPTEVA